MRPPTWKERSTVETASIRPTKRRAVRSSVSPAVISRTGRISSASSIAAPSWQAASPRVARARNVKAKVRRKRRGKPCRERRAWSSRVLPSVVVIAGLLRARIIRRVRCQSLAGPNRRIRLLRHGGKAREQARAPRRVIRGDAEDVVKHQPVRCRAEQEGTVRIGTFRRELIEMHADGSAQGRKQIRILRPGS